MCFFKLKFCFWTKFNVYLHFSPKPLLKKNHKNPFLFNMTSSKKCKICVRISKTNIVCSCFWEAAMQEYFQNKIVLRSSHQDTFFNIAVLQLWWNSLKNTCDWVQFLVKSMWHSPALNYCCGKAIFHHSIN